MLYEMTVAEAYGIKQRKGLLAGVELEWEFAVPFVVNTPLEVSTIKNDGSLRNFGIELVSKPLGLKEITTFGKDIDIVLSEADKAKSQFIDTMRTSMHVHLNVSDMTYGQLMNTVFLYAILEPYFLSKVHKYRRKNNFASPMMSSKGFRNLILDAVVDDKRLPSHEDFKYSAINFGSLAKFGTLEFRSHETTQNIDVVSDWVHEFFRIRILAMEYRTPKEIMRDYRKMTAVEFFNRVFPKAPKDICPAFHDSASNDFLFSVVAQHPDNWDYSKDPRHAKEVVGQLSKKGLAGSSRKEIQKLIAHVRNDNMVAQHRPPDGGGVRVDWMADGGDVNAMLDEIAGDNLAEAPQPRVRFADVVANFQAADQLAQIHRGFEAPPRINRPGRQG